MKQLVIASVPELQLIHDCIISKRKSISESIENDEYPAYYLNTASEKVKKLVQLENHIFELLDNIQKNSD